MFWVPDSSRDRRRIDPIRKPLRMKKRSIPKKIQYDSPMNIGDKRSFRLPTKSPHMMWVTWICSTERIAMTRAPWSAG